MYAGNILDARRNIDLLRIEGDRDFEIAYIECWYHLELDNLDSIEYWFSKLDSLAGECEEQGAKLLFTAWSEQIEGNYNECIRLCDSLEASECYHPIDHLQFLAIKGVAARRVSDYVTAYDCVLKRKSLTTGMNDSDLMGRCLLDEGQIQLDKGHVDKAISIFEMALMEVDTSGGNIVFAKLLGTLARCKTEKGAVDTALKLYSRAEKAFVRIGAKRDQLRILSNLAYFYDFTIENYRLAKLVYARGLSLVRGTKRYGGPHTALASNYGALLLYLKDIDSANALFNEALTIAKRDSLKAYIYKIYDQKFDVFTQKGNADSMARYYRLHDSLKYVVLSEKNEKAFNELVVQYDVALNKSQKLQAQKERDLETAKNKRLTILSISLSALAILAVITTLLVRDRYRNKAKIARQSEALKEKELEQVLREKQVNRMTLLMEGQEQERSRISKELHDSLGSLLSTVKIHFGVVEDKLDRNTEQVNHAFKLLDEACEEVRRISHDMASNVLSKFGLEAAIRDLVEHIQRAKDFDVELVISGDHKRLDENIEIHLFRVVQETVNNVLKHAKATRLCVNFSIWPELVTLIVEDNGVGFSQETAKTKGSMGIENLRARVEHMCGTIQIDSEGGNGTTIIVEVPLSEVSTL